MFVSFSSIYKRHVVVRLFAFLVPPSLISSITAVSGRTGRPPMKYKMKPKTTTGALCKQNEKQIHWPYLYLHIFTVAMVDRHRETRRDTERHKETTKDTERERERERER